VTCPEASTVKRKGKKTVEKLQDIIIQWLLLHEV